MVEIVIPAHKDMIGAIVTGYAISRDYPKIIHSTNPSVLSRLYKGFAKLRAETGVSPKRGFGNLIGGAEILDSEVSRGLKLWLRVQD